MSASQTAKAQSVPSDLDSTIHAPKRLGALAVLRGADRVEFAFLQERLELTKSDLSKQMTTLVESGLVEMHKTGYGRGSTTWYQLTKKGAAEFDAYRAALRAMLDDADG